METSLSKSRHDDDKVLKLDNVNNANIIATKKK
jgi:hypothetical protein